MVGKKPSDPVRIGFLSRIDYGSPGYRQWLVVNGFEIFRQEQTYFNVLAGGLIAERHLKKQMVDEIKDALEGYPSKDRAEMRVELEHAFIDRIAKELARAIPRVTFPDPEKEGEVKIVRLVVVPSPAFDGELGEKIALRLVEKRDDIVLERSGSGRVGEELLKKVLWVLAPEKSVWMRSDYYSTPAERVIKDKVKQTPQSSPLAFAVGCFGSSINKPGGGEVETPYFTIPALHRIEEARVSENQIGVRVLEAFPGQGYRLRTYDQKYLVANELSHIDPPPGATESQKKIIDLIRRHGSVTVSALAKEFGFSERCALSNLHVLMTKKGSRGRVRGGWPGIIEIEGTGRYYFDLKWLQRKLRIPLSSERWKEDRIISYACLHAASIETDYEFFVREVPKTILATGATEFVGAGDLIEGMEHNLDRKGEVVPGYNNYTLQEHLSARLNADVLLEVFRVRFAEWISQKDPTTVDQDGICTAVHELLPNFRYIVGNHDGWVAKDGHIPLDTFHTAMILNLETGIGEILARHGLACSKLFAVAKEKVFHADFFTLASGLDVSVQHPHMARAKTTSLRPQEMLEYAKRHRCQVAIGGNFHVSEHVENYDMDLGQCVVQQIGTIKHGSNFERHKMKLVDQGVGYMRILSNDRRIFMVESAFFGGPKLAPPVNVGAIIDQVTESLGASPISRYGADRSDHRNK